MVKTLFALITSLSSTAASAGTAEVGCGRQAQQVIRELIANETGVDIDRVPRIRPEQLLKTSSDDRISEVYFATAEIDGKNKDLIVIIRVTPDLVAPRDIARVTCEATSFTTL